MSGNFRRRLIAAVTFLSGLYFFLEYILPEKIGEFKFGAYHEEILKGVTLVGSMAIGLGLINILRIHGTRALYGQRGWMNSVALLGGMVVMFIVQWNDFIASQRALGSWKPVSELQLYITMIDKDLINAPAPAANKLLFAARFLNTKGEEIIGAAEKLAAAGNQKAGRAKEEFQLQLNIAKEKVELLRSNFALRASSGDTTDEGAAMVHASALDLNETLKLLTPPAKEISQLAFEASDAKKASALFYNGFFVPLGAAMFALLGFYIANAAYRSFRLKSVEAGVMMATAITVVLGQISYGRMYISENLPQIRLWLMQNVNTPGNRAIYFGAAIGGFAMAMRMWLSLEKNPLEVEEKP